MFTTMCDTCLDTLPEFLANIALPGNAHAKRLRDEAIAGIDSIEHISKPYRIMEGMTLFDIEKYLHFYLGERYFGMLSTKIHDDDLDIIDKVKEGVNNLMDANEVNSFAILLTDGKIYTYYTRLCLITIDICLRDDEEGPFVEMTYIDPLAEPMESIDTANKIYNAIQPDVVFRNLAPFRALYPSAEKFHGHQLCRLLTGVKSFKHHCQYGSPDEFTLSNIVRSVYLIDCCMFLYHEDFDSTDQLFIDTLVKTKQHKTRCENHLEDMIEEVLYYSKESKTTLRNIVDVVDVQAHKRKIYQKTMTVDSPSGPIVNPNYKYKTPMKDRNRNPIISMDALAIDLIEERIDYLILLGVWHQYHWPCPEFLHGKGSPYHDGMKEDLKYFHPFKYPSINFMTYAENNRQSKRNANDRIKEILRAKQRKRKQSEKRRKLRRKLSYLLK